LKAFRVIFKTDDLTATYPKEICQILWKTEIQKLRHVHDSLTFFLGMKIKNSLYKTDALCPDLPLAKENEQIGPLEPIIFHFPRFGALFEIGLKT